MYHITVHTVDAIGSFSSACHAIEYALTSVLVVQQKPDTALDTNKVRFTSRRLANAFMNYMSQKLGESQGTTQGRSATEYLSALRNVFRLRSHYLPSTQASRISIWVHVMQHACTCTCTCMVPGYQRCSLAYCWELVFGHGCFPCFPSQTPLVSVADEEEGHASANKTNLTWMSSSADVYSNPHSQTWQ
jgi:hypothetical protein